MYKLGIKTGVWYPQNVHLVPKNGKICTFYTKNEFFAQKFDPSVQIGDKNWSLVLQNVIWSLKMEKPVLKMKCLPKHLTRLYKLGDKNWSLVPQNVHLVNRNGKKLYFLH